MLRTTFAIPLTQTSTTDPQNEVGQEMYLDGKWYKFLQNKTGGTRAVGDTSCYDPAQDATMTKVYAPATAILNFVAGVWVGAPAADEYGWMQTAGLCASANEMGNASTAKGDNLIGTNGQYYFSRGTATGTAPTYVTGAVEMEAYTTTSAALKKVYLKCRV